VDLVTELILLCAEIHTSLNSAQKNLMQPTVFKVYFQDQKAGFLFAIDCLTGRFSP
jgi:hypothetical protein